MPKVSVIIPVYNAEKYLSQCLDSVVKQTFKDFEVICVNDGSKDNSAHILYHYAFQYPNVRVLNQKNKGSSVARNTGMEMAKGEYIYFMDADDYIHPQLLEITHYMAQKHKAPLVAFNIMREDKGEVLPTDNFKKYNPRKIKAISTIYPLKYHSYINSKMPVCNSVCLKLLHRDLLKGVKFKQGNFYEDFIFSFILMSKNPRTAIIPQKLYYYRKNEESKTNIDFSPKKLYGYYQALSIIREEYQFKTNQKEWQFIKGNILPEILERVAGLIDNSSLQSQRFLIPMWKYMLMDLAQNKCIPWGGGGINIHNNLSEYPRMQRAWPVIHASWRQQVPFQFFERMRLEEIQR